MNIEDTLHLLNFYKIYHPFSKVVVTSGFYNPLHINHLKYLQAAKKLGEFHVAIINSDAAQIRKSGISFLDEKTREAIVHELRCVDLTCIWDGDTVEGALEILRPNIFAKGGDRSSIDSLNPKEVEVCKKYDIEIVFGVGGSDKTVSSSRILNTYVKDKYLQNLNKHFN